MSSPVHWEPAWSSAHQRWFYQDRKNGSSSWTQPPGCTIDLPVGPPSDVQRDREAAQDLPPGWESEWDQKHKMYYYFNRKTKERTWKKPGGAGAAAAGSSAPVGPGGGAAPQGRNLDVPARAGAAAGASGSGPPSPASPAPRDALAPPRHRGDLGREPSPQAGRLGGANGWDSGAFLERLARAKATGEQDRVKAVRREVAEHNYEIRHRWPVPRTSYVAADSVLQRRMPSFQAEAPVVSFSNATTADAVQMLARASRRPRICALNFANGVKVGGGYKTGALAQEEDLCRRIPSLYTSLFNAQRDGFYPFGPSTCSSPSRPEKYCDVLWTPKVAIARAGEERGFALLAAEEQDSLCLVAAAAPNVRFARPKDIKDVNLMYDTVKTIFISPRLMEPELDTLVLGAWGCGAFGGDPQEISELFCRALSRDGLGRLYKEVHFAIPKGGPEDRNGDAFREALRRHGIAVRDLGAPTV